MDIQAKLTIASVRFLKGFVAGALAAMVLLLPMNVASLDELNVWLTALAIACVQGGLTGGLLALQKYYAIK